MRTRSVLKILNALLLKIERNFYVKICQFIGGICILLVITGAIKKIKILAQNQMDDKFNILEMSTNSGNKLTEGMQKLKELIDIIQSNKINEKDNSIAEQILKEAKFVDPIAKRGGQSIEDVSNTINSNLNKFSSDDIINLLDSFKNDISHLSQEQLFSLIHVFFIIALFIAVINLAIVFYGDSLIIKLNLENRFPKLASIIRFRRKFQQYYFGWNFFIIISVLSVLLYFNLLVFLT